MVLVWKQNGLEVEWEGKTNQMILICYSIIQHFPKEIIDILYQLQHSSQNGIEKKKKNEETALLRNNFLSFNDAVWPVSYLAFQPV